MDPFRERMLVLQGICDKVRGDGDNPMRGIGCLLTGIELFPGNIQGGSHTPAGWSSGISLDQELKNFLQKSPEARTRFGSLEFGVMVPERADTWTRMVYKGPNKPVAPIDDPYQMLNRLYGHAKDRELLNSILDDVQADLRKVEAVVSAEDRRLLDEHATFVREMEQELKSGDSESVGWAKEIPTRSTTSRSSWSATGSISAWVGHFRFRSYPTTACYCRWHTDLGTAWNDLAIPIIAATGSSRI